MQFCGFLMINFGSLMKHLGSEIKFGGIQGKSWVSNDYLGVSIESLESPMMSLRRLMISFWSPIKIWGIR